MAVLTSPTNRVRYLLANNALMRQWLGISTELTETEQRDAALERIHFQFIGDFDEKLQEDESTPDTNFPCALCYFSEYTGGRPGGVTSSFELQWNVGVELYNTIDESAEADSNTDQLIAFEDETRLIIESALTQSGSNNSIAVDRFSMVEPPSISMTSEEWPFLIVGMMFTGRRFGQENT